MECTSGNHWLYLNKGEEDLVVMVGEKLCISQGYSMVSKVTTWECLKLKCHLLLMLL